MSDEARSCPECGAVVTGGFQFCPTCGIRLLSIGAVAERPEPIGAPEPPSPVPPPPARESWTAERRLVSVLFVDLVGFTSISEQLDPEDVREMQSRYFEAARATVARYGGTLEKFIGDAVMAVWGSPIAHENDAERAVRAALELVRNVGSIAPAATSGKRLQARAAITTGEAAVSVDRAGEGMVTGDMVNTASRLQEVAPPGTVLIDDPTRRAVGNAANVQSAGDKALKGKAAPVRAWRVVEATGPEGTDSVAGHAGPFVGRRPEMESLVAIARSVVAERRTMLVSIIGVAGIGKSRVGRELERRLDGTPGPRWYRGRPPRWGHGSAFAPVAEMVRRSLGVAEHDPAEVVRRTLAEALNRLVEDEAEREWVEPRVHVLLDPSVPVPSEREELFAAWRRFFEAEAADGGLVVVFEDLQWADAETLDFIDYLATWSRRNPILVLTMARPELLETRPTWGAGIPQFRAMHLERLSDAEVDELLSALAPDLPPDVATRVRERAQGVPLYAVEMARMVTERVAQTGVPVVSADIPESLHALLAARIDALPDPERSVLLMAAVLGRRFRPGALAALAGLERRELGERLGTLVRREFLAMDDEPGSPGRGQLSFVQDLMRDVAYGTLSRRDRRRYHLAVIQHLEAAGDPEAIEPVAEHLVAAHASTSATEPDAGALARRAVDALQRAADHAATRHAHHRALAHLERALSLTDEPGSRAEIAETAAMVARAAARFGVAERHLREAIDLRDALDDTVAATRDRAQLASVLLQAQHSDSALAELEGAWGANRAAGESDAAMVHLASELARAYMLRGDTGRAIEWADRAITAGASNPDETAAFVTDARVSLGTAMAQGGRPEEGLAELRRAIDDSAERGQASVELRARTNLAWLTVSDDPRAAAETARRGVEIARQVGSREWLLQLLDVAGFIAVETGEWDWALAALDEVAGSDLPTAYRLDYAATRCIIAAVRGEGEPLGALEGLGPPEPDLDPHALGWTEIARATSAMVAGDMDAALGQARTTAERTIGWERAEALALSGRIAAWSGRSAEAADALATLEGEPAWGRAAAARLQTLRAAVRALEKGGGDDAAELWVAALDAWQALRLPYRTALCLADRWFLRGDPADREAATRLLAELGAAGLVTLLAAREPLRSSAAPSTPTG